MFRKAVTTFSEFLAVHAATQLSAEEDPFIAALVPSEVAAETLKMSTQISVCSPKYPPRAGRRDGRQPYLGLISPATLCSTVALSLEEAARQYASVPDSGSPCPFVCWCGSSLVCKGPLCHNASTTHIMSVALATTGHTGGTTTAVYSFATSSSGVGSCNAQSDFVTHLFSRERSLHCHLGYGALRRRSC